MERENYINIQGWMVTDLHLKGNELLTFALVYGFCQDGESIFQGSSRYIAEWLGSSPQTALNTLKSLQEKNLVIITVKTINNIKCFNYQINFDTVQNFWGVSKNWTGGVQKLDRGCPKIRQLPNNTNNYINNNKPPFISTLNKFLEFWALYPKQRAGSKQKAQIAYLKVLKEKRATEEHLLAKVKEYANSREVREGFAKGCAAWLNDDRFNSNYTGGTNNGIGKDYNRENTGEYSGLGRKIGF